MLRPTVCVYSGSGGDQEGAVQNRPGEGARGVQGQPASVKESEPNDRPHRQDHPGTGEGQGHPGRSDGQWNNTPCWVRSELLI